MYVCVEWLLGWVWAGSKAIEEGDILPSSQVYLNLVRRPQRAAKGVLRVLTTSCRTRFASQVKAFCLLFVVYYFGQVFTYFFREQRMTMDDIERVGACCAASPRVSQPRSLTTRIWHVSGLLVVFQGFLGAARLAMMRIVQAKNMRTVHEPVGARTRVVTRLRSCTLPRN